MNKKLWLSMLIAGMTGCSISSDITSVNTALTLSPTSVTGSNIKVSDGYISLTDKQGLVSTQLKYNDKKTKLEKIEIEQLPVWDNWQAVEKVVPAEAKDAPVFIPVGDKDYWLLARHAKHHKTGYHAWHSTDMKNWVHHGPVSEHDKRWVTSAEYLDGKFYIYFDKPNDEDPHLIIDDDLTDGKQGKVVGKIFEDPTHGSDMAILRDEDGTFHLIYEDWSPIDASKHSWDSPLAGHADSPDGINGFEPHEHEPPIDVRTTPTGKILPYQPHPNQMESGRDPTPYTYQEHQGPQDAFGDYTLIKIGKQYYLFCDYEPHDKNKSMRVGRWRSDDINKQFVWDGEIGEGFHPDPTVGFAEGKFYLLVQRSSNDFVSSGPWVDGVQARAGVDIDNDGTVDQWTDFTQVKARYKAKAGFARVVEQIPATLDVSELASGYQFTIELKLSQQNNVSPIISNIKAQTR